MQINFLTSYFIEDGKIVAQEELLFNWQQAIQKSQVKFIPCAKIEFKDYDFFEYPDQEKSKNFIHRSYGLFDIQTNPLKYFWNYKYYDNIESIYEAMSKQKRLMELIITVEDE